MPLGQIGSRNMMEALSLGGINGFHRNVMQNGAEVMALQEPRKAWVVRTVYVQHCQDLRCSFCTVGAEQESVYGTL